MIASFTWALLRGKLKILDRRLWHPWVGPPLFFLPQERLRLRKKEGREFCSPARALVLRGR